MLIGYIVALLRAFIGSGLTATQKNVLKNQNSLYLTILVSLISFVIMIFGLFFISINAYSSVFYIAVILSALLNIVAGFSRVYSIKHVDLSLIVPFFNLLPVLATINGFIFLGEKLTLFELLGITLIFLGSLFLNYSKGKNIFTSFALLFKNKGILVGFLCIILYSFTIILDKIGINNSNPFVYSIMLWIFIGLATLFITIGISFKVNVVKEFNKFKSQKLFIIGIVLSGLILTILTMASFKLLPVGVASSIFQVETLLTILAGKVIFKEEKIAQRFLATIVMVFGVVILFL